MAQRMNYDRARHVGRPTEAAFDRKPETWHPNQAAKAASPVRQVSDEGRMEMEVQLDERQRDEKSRKRELVTLVREPEIHETPKGRMVVFRGTQEGRDVAIRAVLAASPAERYGEEARDALNERLRRIGGGDKVSLAGTWAKRHWERDGVRREHWEFQVQRFQPGDVPLERMLGRQRDGAAFAAISTTLAQGASRCRI